MRFRIQEPADAIVGGHVTMVQASAENPADIEVPDSWTPGVKWEPLDEAAVAALEKAARARLEKAEAELPDGKKLAPAAKARILAVRPLNRKPLPPKDSGEPEPMTLRDAGEGGPKKQRAADR